MFFTIESGGRSNRPEAPSRILPGAERGIALVITLLLLVMMSLIGLGMVLTLRSDMMINGYYGNYRGSFYAADSGINVAREQLLNQVLNQVPSTFATPPLPAGSAATALNYVTTTYGNSVSINTGQAAVSWSGGFAIVNTATCTNSFALAPGSPSVTSLDSNGAPNSYQYLYNYQLCSTGQASGSEQSTIAESGSIIINVNGNAAASKVSFASFGAFVDNYPPCLGPLVPGTMTGPMFTNGAWGFMPGGQYIFTDPVGQANANASYFDSSWNCHQSPNSSFTANGQTIAPVFEGGFNVGQPPVPLPPNDFSQKEAVLDGSGLACGSAPGNCPTLAQMNASLKNVSSNAYPLGGASSGVYMDYSTSGGTSTLTGGGFYVEGDASITVAPSGAQAEVYTISQGNPAVVTTITVDPVSNTTVVSSGAHTLTLQGIPTNCSLVTPAPATCPAGTPGSTPGTMLYVNGNITGLTGPGEGKGGINDNEAVTITASNNITITGDVIYKTEPVTTYQNQIPGTPMATLIPGNDKNQDLGIFTAGGSIYLQSPYPDDNLQVDGSQAPVSAGGTGGFFVNGCINTFNNVGGQIQTDIYGACLNVQNTYFDRRYTSKPGFAPPWFPATVITQTSATGTTTSNAIQRSQWVATSSQ